jgi:TRAP-type C4-dicarboxylate transport system permease small subunit
MGERPLSRCERSESAQSRKGIAGDFSVTIGWITMLDRLLGRVLGAVQWLALPLALLLFLQWPLRDLVHGYSTQANDLAQIFFALSVAASVAAAARAGTHLAADSIAQRYSPRTRARLKKIGAIAIVPWALFVLIASKQLVTESVALLENFSQTFNPGYFVIKLALWLMALTVLAQSIIELVRPRAPDAA